MAFGLVCRARVQTTGRATTYNTPFVFKVTRMLLTSKSGIGLGSRTGPDKQGPNTMSDRGVWTNSSARTDHEQRQNTQDINFQKLPSSS